MRVSLERLRRMPPWRIDAVLGTCFVLAGLTTTNPSSPVFAPRDGVAIGLVLAATLPYYFRRLASLPVFAMSTAAVAALFVNRYSGGALPLVVAVGAYMVGAHRPLREVVVAGAFMNLAFVVMVVAGSPDFGAASFVASVAVFSATMLAGWTMQSRGLRLDALEREQGEASLRAVADERLRIATRLHQGGANASKKARTTAAHPMTREQRNGIGLSRSLRSRNWRQSVNVVPSTAACLGRRRPRAIDRSLDARLDRGAGERFGNKPRCKGLFHVPVGNGDSSRRVHLPPAHLQSFSMDRHALRDGRWSSPRLYPSLAPA